MRRVLLLLPLFALAACKEETPQGGVKVIVSYDGFKPGCVRVMARDVDGGHEPLSTDVAGEKVKGAATGGSIVVGVLPPDNWGSQLEVEAQAFERTCTGAPVVKNSQSVTMTRGQATTTTLQLLAMDKDADGYVAQRSGGTDCNDDRANINPGVTEELCNGLDDNCNGTQDPEELQLGQPCTEGASCQGTRACGDNGKVVCNVPSAIMAYPDVDRDGHGDKTASATAFCDGVPVGYVTSPNDDCDDSAATGANVFPGAQELCDGKNNDCDAQTDEDYPALNQPCTDQATQCGGTQQCTAQGTATTCVIPLPVPTWYLDNDGDGYGRNAGSQQTCVQPVGAYVSQGDDCDDGNRFTYRNAPELCDGLDNDCDTLPEATAVCPAGGPTWGERTEGSATQLWISVSTWTPDGGVWVVGDNNRRAVKRQGDTVFSVTASAAGGCGNSGTAWNAVWADPNNNGRAYFLSSGGRFARQDASSTDCTQVIDGDLANYGITGFQHNSVLELYGVSDSSTLNAGAAFRWDGVSTTLTYTPPTNGIAFVYDVHGIARDTLFAVGGYDTGNEPRIYRYRQSDGTWQTTNVQTSTSGLFRLNGVWVVNDKVAFAVGQSGSALRWNGTVWSKLTFPTADNLTSVVAFGANSAYAVTTNGRIYRYNGTDWTRIHELAGTTFRDIAGTSPADLWVVGSNGKILHWPQ